MQPMAGPWGPETRRFDQGIHARSLHGIHERRGLHVSWQSERNSKEETMKRKA